MLSDTGSEPIPSIARKVLLKFYPNVVTLLEYLCAVVPAFSTHLASSNKQAETVLDELKALLSCTLVGYHELDSNTSFTPARPEMEQEEVLLVDYSLLPQKLTWNSSDLDNRSCSTHYL